jgi:hypothetical protein
VPEHLEICEPESGDDRGYPVGAEPAHDRGMVAQLGLTGDGRRRGHRGGDQDAGQVVGKIGAQQLGTVGQDRSTALFQLAAEVPAAILARTLGIHTDVAVTWQRQSAGDWTTVLGAVAVYLLGVFANRLREGQELAERLVIELDRNQSAQAVAAALAERHQMAREMHDILAHSLTGVVLHLEGARMLAARTAPDPRLSAAVEEAHHLVCRTPGEPSGRCATRSCQAQTGCRT